MINTILLAIPPNILIDTVGTGTYGGCTIAELVANNSYFTLDGDTLLMKTIETSVLVTGTVNGEPYEQTFTA